MKRLITGHIYSIGIIVILWLLLETLFYNIASDAQEQYKKNLIKQAAFYDKEVRNTRNWNNKLGGIYAFADKVETNLYVQDTLLETDEGDLIKINPGWMTRMLSQNSDQEILKYSLVSNKPINANNKATGFFAKKLQEMEASSSQEPIYELDDFNKRLYYMQPVYTTQNCLECHVEKNYAVGDLRGATVIDMDASFTLERTQKVWYSFYFVSIFTTLFVVLAILFIRNLSQQKIRYLRKSIELEKTLKQKVLKLNQVLSASQIGYWEWNVQTQEYSVDSQWLNILGLSEESSQKSSKEWMRRVHRDDLKIIIPIIKNAMNNGTSYSLEYRMKHNDGHYVWIQGSGGVTSFNLRSNTLKLSGTHQDITQRKLLEIEQKNNEEYLNTLFERNPNIIIVTDGNDIMKANNAFFKFFDEYDSIDSFRQEHRCICEYFIHSQGDDFVTNEYVAWIEEVFSSSEPVAKISYKEQEHYFAVYAKRINDNGSSKIIVTFNNITEIYALRKRFEELSIVDELTKIYNRRHFNTLFETEVNRARRELKSFCFIIMDIDHFKLYNDNYGHAQGDNALVSFAQELKEITKRSNEFCFRLGGEEFGIIFSPDSKEEALTYAQNICKRIESLGIEHLYNLPSKHLSVSIGLIYKEAGEKFDSKLLYRQADQALYLAKERGRNRVEIFLG